MRPRQAIILSIGALGAGLIGASVHGVTTVNADLERIVQVRQMEQRMIKHERDCPFPDRPPATTRDTGV